MGPCKNPACKSYGQIHPHCRCYGLAAGGSVGRFCDSERSHEPNCQYFAEGGVSGLEPVPPEDMPESSQGLEPVPADDMPESHGLEPVPADDIPNNYGTTGQQIITGLEGAAQGVAGPLATLAETDLLGVPAQDIAGRAAENPLIHGASEAAGLTGSLLTGVGEAGLIARGAEHLVPVAAGKIGGAVLKGFITNGLIQGGDEISRGILGTGDPQAPVSAALVHMGAAGLLGGAIGGAGVSALSALGDSKLGTRAASLLAGVADGNAEAAGLPIKDAPIRRMTYSGQDAAMYKLGSDAAKKLIPLTSMGLAGRAGYTVGEGVLPGGGGYLFGGAISKLLQKPISSAVHKYAVPVALKVLSSGEPIGLWNALDYATDMGRGALKINKGITGLFQGGAQQLVDEATHEDQEKIKKFVSEGTLNRQIQSQSGQDATIPAYAEGGEVTKPLPAPPVLGADSAIAKHFPEQNILLQAAKGRVNNYLNGLRPQEHQAKLPFDKPMKNAEAERKYGKAVAIAAQPLSILNHVAKGTLTPESLGHFVQMYPEVHQELSKRMTEKITELQAKEEMIPYRLRQSMSLFLGAPLDSTLTPGAMRAAQAVYSQSPGQPPAPPVTKSKRNTSKLGKVAEDAYTSDQAAAKRQASIRP